MSKTSRFLIFLLVCVIAVLFLLPTFRWYAGWGVTQEEKDLAVLPGQDVRNFATTEAEKKWNDFDGLTRTTPDDVISETYEFLIPIAKENAKEMKVKRPSEWTYLETAKLAFPNLSEDEAKALFIQTDAVNLVNRIQDVRSLRESALKLGLDLNGGISFMLKADVDWSKVTPGDDPVMDAMDVIYDRVDAFKVSEPTVRKVGADRILIELPGARDSERIKTFLMGKGSLNFHIVDSEQTAAFRAYLMETYGTTKSGFDTADTEAQAALVESGIVKPGYTVMGLYDKDVYGEDELRDYLVVTAVPDFSGVYLSDVARSQDQYGKPAVSFRIGTEGTDADGNSIDPQKRFADLTDANKGKTMVIALDEKIKAAATISGRIAGGNVQISGSFTNEEAENLRKLLKTGVLPVELQVEEIQEVNASLGQDAIQSGIWALFVGFFSVFIFMMLYYRGGGLIADFALFLDVVFIFAILAKLGFTMTLTSLAGIILSIGMSVDANVIIFERMREEQRAGKSAVAGLKAGYDKALWALIDANVTTLIAALVLSVLGTGSIQGFAYTLAVGVVCSMFTAIFVTRLIFDFCYETLKVKRIQVMWGGKKYENN